MIDRELDVNRAQRAAAILNDPIWVEAYERLRQEIFSAWETSPARDVEGREVLALSVKLLAQLRAHMESLMDSGEMASVELSRRGLSASP